MASDVEPPGPHISVSIPGGTGFATLRDWEQGRSVPPGAVLCLMKIALKHPEVLAELAA